MKKTIKKLKLERETVRKLTGDGLRNVMGGGWTTGPDETQSLAEQALCYPSGVTGCITQMAGHCTVLTNNNCQPQ